MLRHELEHERQRYCLRILPGKSVFTLELMANLAAWRALRGNSKAPVTRLVSPVDSAALAALTVLAIRAGMAGSQVLLIMIGLALAAGLSELMARGLDSWAVGFGTTIAVVYLMELAAIRVRRYT